MSPAPSPASRLYAATINCIRCERDPGSAQLNVGSETEPRWVPRAEAWRDFYARGLLLDVGAEPELVKRCRDYAETKLQNAIAGNREHGRNANPEFWECAVNISAIAEEILTSSDADRNLFARQRLLAGIEHLMITTTLGSLPQVNADAGATLAATLARIDESDPDSTPGKGAHP
ncbi:hypothetical protein [Nocardia transvalensis]|uniref:hypothetical protein n=1 Tax=Nocardia transvalensis TaxID=37333 RepID=UPI001895B2C8|nr:hypothetical protein [Nocardia transvalensis]MBF6333638.1 hypothetical protein [Nocardia transvalensis]